MKKSILLCLLLCFTLGASAQTYYKCTGDNVNVRKGPGKNYGNVEGWEACNMSGSVQLCKGDKVKFLGVKKNGFMKVEDANLDGLMRCWGEGWVSAQYLTPMKKCDKCHGEGTNGHECRECGGLGWNCCFWTGKEPCEKCGYLGYY